MIFRGFHSDVVLSASSGSWIRQGLVGIDPGASSPMTIAELAQSEVFVRGLSNTERMNPGRNFVTEERNAV